MKKKQHGGARKGAGRPVTKEPTVVMRIPLSKVEAVRKFINDNHSADAIKYWTFRA